MRFTQAGVGDANEAALLAHLGDVVGTDVEHGLVQAADHLVQHGAQRTAVRHFAFDTLRHDLVGARDVRLEVTILGIRLLTSRCHGSH